MCGVADRYTTALSCGFSRVGEAERFGCILPDVFPNIALKSAVGPVMEISVSRPDRMPASQRIGAVFVESGSIRPVGGGELRPSTPVAYDGHAYSNPMFSVKQG